MNRMFNRPVGPPLIISVRPNNYDSFRKNRRRISLAPETGQPLPPVSNNVEDGEEENPRSAIVLQQGESTTEDRNTASFSSAAGALQDVVNNVLRNRNRARNITIEMENRTCQGSGGREISAITTNDPANALQSYLRFMFYTGVIPYKVNEQKTHPVTSAINKVLFVLVTLFALLHALDNIKYFAIQFIDERTLPGFIGLGFDIKTLIVRVLFAVILIFLHKRIDRLFKILLAKRMHGDFVIDSTHISNTAAVLACLTFTLSLVAALHSGVYWSTWSVQNMVTLQAYNGRHIVGVWLPDTYKNVTEELWNASVNEGMQASNLAWALLGFTETFCGYLVDSCMKDLMLLASISLATYSKWFVDNLKPETCKPEEKIDALEVQLRRRSRLKQIAFGYNSTLGSIFTWLHISNLFLFAYFLLTSYRNKTDGFMRITKLLVDVVRISFTYYKAAKASSHNKSLLKWILFNFGRRDYNNEASKIDINVTIHEIKYEPIGIGRGDFIITENFVFRLLTFVISYFMFLAEDEADDAYDDEED